MHDIFYENNYFLKQKVSEKDGLVFCFCKSFYVLYPHTSYCIQSGSSRAIDP